MKPVPNGLNRYWLSSYTSLATNPPVHVLRAGKAVPESDVGDETILGITSASWSP